MCWELSHSLSMAVGTEPTDCCQEWPWFLLLPQPWCCSPHCHHRCCWSMLPGQGRGCCGPHRQWLCPTTCPLSVWAGGSGSIVAQDEATCAVLSTRTFRMPAGGWLGLGSCSALTVASRFWVPACWAVAGPLLCQCKGCGCMGTGWLVGKFGLANGLRSAAGSADMTWPPALPLHQLSPGHASKLGRCPHPA